VVKCSNLPVITKIDPRKATGGSGKVLVTVVVVVRGGGRNEAPVGLRCILGLYRRRGKRNFFSRFNLIDFLINLNATVFTKRIYSKNKEL